MVDKGRWTELVFQLLSKLFSGVELSRRMRLMVPFDCQAININGCNGKFWVSGDLVIVEETLDLKQLVEDILSDELITFKLA